VQPAASSAAAARLGLPSVLPGLLHLGPPRVGRKASPRGSVVSTALLTLDLSTPAGQYSWTDVPSARPTSPPPARDPRRLPTACAMDGMPMPHPGGGGLAPIRPGSGLAPLSGSGQLPSLLLGSAGWPLARSLVRSLAR
jgi:hypothetical protein